MGTWLPFQYGSLMGSVTPAKHVAILCPEHVILEFSPC